MQGISAEIVAQPSLLELGLRFGVVALGLFMAIQMLRTKLPSVMMASGAIFDVGIGAFALISSPWISRELGSFYIPMKLLAITAPGFFWLYAITLFNDRFELRFYHLLPIAVLLGLQSYHFVLETHNVGEFCLICTLCEFLSLALFISVPFVALRHLRSDLVEARRYFRLACGTLIPVIGVFFSSRHIMELLYGEPSVFWNMLDAVVLFAVTLQFSLWLTHCENEMVEVQHERDGLNTTKPINAVDALELDQLEKLISDGVCFEEGLTIGGLAGKLDMPEHRLRVLINKGLGYRNFSAFLNDHRIEVAKKWLSDPSRGREQIIQIAYGLGYASLAPFNRAFRERVGVSPSQFRSEVF